MLDRRLKAHGTDGIRFGLRCPLHIAPDGIVVGIVCKGLAIDSMDCQAGIQTVLTGNLVNTDNAVSRHRTATFAKVDADPGRQARATPEQTRRRCFNAFALATAGDQTFQCREQDFRHSGYRNPPAPYGIEQVFLAGNRQGFQRRLERHVLQRFFMLGQCLFQ